MPYLKSGLKFDNAWMTAFLRKVKQDLFLSHYAIVFFISDHMRFLEYLNRTSPLYLTDGRRTTLFSYLSYPFGFCKVYLTICTFPNHLNELEVLNGL